MFHRSREVERGRCEGVLFYASNPFALSGTAGRFRAQGVQVSCRTVIKNRIRESQSRLFCSCFVTRISRRARQGRRKGRHGEVRVVLNMELGTCDVRHQAGGLRLQYSPKTALLGGYGDDGISDSGICPKHASTATIPHYIHINIMLRTLLYGKRCWVTRLKSQSPDIRNGAFCLTVNNIPCSTSYVTAGSAILVLAPGTLGSSSAK